MNGNIFKLEKRILHMTCRLLNNIKHKFYLPIDVCTVYSPRTHLTFVIRLKGKLIGYINEALNNALSG